MSHPLRILWVVVSWGILVACSGDAQGPAAVGANGGSSGTSVESDSGRSTDTGGASGTSGTGGMITTAGSGGAPGSDASAGGRGTTGGTGGAASGTGGAGRDGSVGGANAGGGTSGTGAVNGSGGSADGGPVGAACTSDAGCASNRRCDTRAKQCVACLFDTDCAWGSVCEDRACTPAKYCLGSSACTEPGRTRCDSTRNRCVECLGDNDCAANQRCFGTLCKPIEACTNTLDCPSGKVCQTTRRMCQTCVVDTDCAGGKVCKNADCVPGCRTSADCNAGLCDGKGCVECLADLDCPDAYHCTTGQCVLDMCESNRRLCGGGNVTAPPGIPQFVFGRAACNGRGDAFTTVVECGTNETCVTNSTDGACVSRACSPGAVSCTSDRTGYGACSDDGTAFVSTTLCTGGKQCAQGACYTFVCEPSSVGCSADHLSILSCNGTGTQQTQTACGASRYCTVSNSVPNCISQICVPNEVHCVGNVVAQCNAYGGGNTTTDDCSVKNQLCSANKCGDTVIDSMGTGGMSPLTATADGLTGQTFEVKAARSLRKIEFDLNFSDARTLTWIVYEGTAVSGTYTKVSETTTNVTGTGDGYYASGALNVPLAAGKYYAFAVHWNDTSTDLTYPVATGGFGTPVSFGTGWYGVIGTGAVPATLDVSGLPFISAWRITTGVP